MHKLNPEFTFSKVLAILNAFFLCYVSHYLYQHERMTIELYLTFIAFPLGSTTLLFWYNRYLIAMGIFLLLILLSIGSNMGCGFDYDARYNTTKSNLSSIRSAIQMYRARNSKFPQATISGATRSTLNKKQTLEAILSNTAGHGDGQEYIVGAIPGELISDVQGDNFVCIVLLQWQFLSDQSQSQHCLNPEKSDARGTTLGGYVYFPTDGQIRLNYKIYQDDLLFEKQSNVGEMFSDWTEWSSKNPELTDDYPVKW